MSSRVVECSEHVLVMSLRHDHHNNIIIIIIVAQCTCILIIRVLHVIIIFVKNSVCIFLAIVRKNSRDAMQQ